MDGDEEREAGRIASFEEILVSLRTEIWAPNEHRRNGIRFFLKELERNWRD
jgi:hypothetical protein